MIMIFDSCKVANSSLLETKMLSCSSPRGFNKNIQYEKVHLQNLCQSHASVKIVSSFEQKVYYKL